MTKRSEADSKPKITADEYAALLKLFEAWNELRLLGWQDPRYFKFPEQGVEFELIELGSTGIHRAVRLTTDPLDTCWVDGEWPSRPSLVRSARWTKQSEAEPKRCPECGSDDRNSHNLISHGALVPCDHPWHSTAPDAGFIAEGIQRWKKGERP